MPHNTTENTEKKKGKKNPFGKYIFRIFRKDINLKDMKGQLQPTLTFLAVVQHALQRVL